jgi:hypothetical protein
MEFVAQPEFSEGQRVRLRESADGHAVVIGFDGDRMKLRWLARDWQPSPFNVLGRHVESQREGFINRAVIARDNFLNKESIT